MKRRLLDILTCPGCRGSFSLDVFRERAAVGLKPVRVSCEKVCGWRGMAVADAGVTAADCTRCHASDVEGGALRCLGCGRAFPVIAGVPRLLAPALLARLTARFPSFFAEHPELVPHAERDHATDELIETFECFTRQRLDLGTPGAEFARQWCTHLRRILAGAIALEALRGKLVLDVGCGFGRHLYTAGKAGAEVVGFDLSGGVDVARKNNAGNPGYHLVQADIHDRPFRDGVFDVVWCIGVLHHLPDPHAGFGAIVPYARAGGVVVIWVYGYRGMAWTYRLSHMRPLARLMRSLPVGARVGTSKVVATLLSVLYWGPMRLARYAGLAQTVGRLPLASYLDHGWRARVAAVHDRLATPIVHFHERDELLSWFGEAALAQVVVEDTERRGWRAHGWRQMPATGGAIR